MKKILIDLKSWDKFLPQPEKQRKLGLETSSCVTQAIINNYEAQFNYAYQKGRITGEPLQFLYDNGYFKDEYIQFSKRAIAKLSETSKRGNTAEDVSNAILRYGLPPETAYPWNEADTWEKYYQEVPQEVIDLGAKFKKHFGLGRGWIQQSQFKEYLKQSMIPGSVFAWVRNENKYNNLYYRPNDANRNHFVALFGYSLDGNQKIWDSYDPYVKRLHKSNYIQQGLYGKILIRNNMTEDIKKLLKDNDQGTIVNDSTQETGYVLRQTVITLPRVRDKVDMLIDMKNRGVITKSAEFVSQETWDDLPKLTLKEFREK